MPRGAWRARRLFLAGVRVIVEGREHLQPASVYACNHASNIDPPAIFRALEPLFPRLRVVYKAELRRLPVLVWAFDAAGFVPLQRGNPEQSRPAIERAAEGLRAGNSFVIFPKARRRWANCCHSKGRIPDGDQGPGADRPGCVSGGLNAMRKGSPLIWPVTIRVNLGEPVLPQEGHRGSGPVSRKFAHLSPAGCQVYPRGRSDILPSCELAKRLDQSPMRFRVHAGPLSIYLRCLNDLEKSGIKTTSSRALAERYHLNAAQIRKDWHTSAPSVCGRQVLRRGSENPFARHPG
jgi:1-acyl-sn-glycerol-3-phosphate acyltransferase